MFQKYKKTGSISLAIICTILISIGIYLGAKDKLFYTHLNPTFSKADSLIKALEEKEKVSPPTPEQKYNLSVLYLKKGDFDKARDTFQQLINSGTNNHQLLISAFYNLGNTFAKKAETESDTSKALQLYQESLKNYRGALDLIRQEEKYLEETKIENQDVEHNFALIKSRIKILTNKLKKEQQSQKKALNPYQLVSQIASNEKKIEALLNQLKKTNLSSEITEIKQQILKLRAENKENLILIKQQVAIPPDSTPVKPASPPIPLKSQPITTI